MDRILRSPRVGVLVFAGVFLTVFLLSAGVWGRGRSRGGMGLLSGNFFYSQTNQPGHPVDHLKRDFSIDARAGYILPMGLFLGAMYSYIGVGDSTGTDLGQLVGGSVGYHSASGFFTTVTYHFLGDLKRGLDQKWKKAQGWQADMGWVFRLTRGLRLGPQLTYRNIHFKELETGGVTSELNQQRETIRPYLSLWVLF